MTAERNGESQWAKNASNIKVFIVDEEMLRRKQQKLRKGKKMKIETANEKY